MKFLLVLPIPLQFCPSIVSVVENDDRLTQFAEMLNWVGVTHSIGETVFAPSSDAREKFRLEDMERWKRYAQQAGYFLHVRDLLERHLVAEGQFTADDRFNGQRGFLENEKGTE
jgi:hypothetical protein